jgi:lipoate-protein ligase A
MPPRQPDYRRGRPHGSFVANLPLAALDMRRAVVAAWHAEPSKRDWPRARVAALVADRYSRPDWNLKR